MSEPDEVPTWRVRTGAGLLIHAPGLSEERRKAEQAEDDAIQAKLKADAKLREQAATEDADTLRLLGRERSTVADVLARVSYGVTPEVFAANADQILQTEARFEKAQDQAQKRREAEAAELAGRPPQYLGLLREAKAEREAKAAEAEETPVSQAEFGRVVSKLKTTIENTFGKRLLK